ncbi:MAG: enoyl-CoA hydratase/isomerase family protein [Gammaproteobacteria bacterium]|nr:enoyl-CoA hydratase/isomerase family protein [Gammaproteobacteria bacterium]
MIETLRHDAVAELCLTNPPANAMGLPFIHAVTEAVRSAPDEGARAIVLSNSGTIFSAGLDVPSLLPLERDGIVTLWRDLFHMMRSMIASPIPVIGALGGHAPAGGCVMAICCDYRIMAEEPKFKIGLNEVAVGIPMPDMLYQVLRYLVGSHQAANMCTTAELMTPQKALRIGLVNELAPADQVRDLAINYAQGVTQLPPNAMQQTRQRTRSELLEMAPEPDEQTLMTVVDSWFTEETQATLRGLVARLKSR